MSRAARLLVFLTALSAIPTGPALGQRAGVSSYVFPTSANVLGAFGAFFKTRLILYNPNLAAITVAVDIATPGGPMANTIQMSENSGIFFDDFLGTMFDYTGGAGIRIHSLDGSPLQVTAEVYADGPNGRFTTPVPNLTAEDKVPTEAEQGFSNVIGLYQDQDNRVNVGCANLGSADATITVYSASPAGQEHRTFTLPAGTWHQEREPLQSNPIYVHFKADATDAVGTYCWGVEVNNASNDGTVYPARWGR
jgi:hypothetical protein